MTTAGELIRDARENNSTWGELRDNALKDSEARKIDNQINKESSHKYQVISRGGSHHHRTSAPQRESPKPIISQHQPEQIITITKTDSKGKTTETNIRGSRAYVQKVREAYKLENQRIAQGEVPKQPNGIPIMGFKGYSQDSDKPTTNHKPANWDDIHNYEVIPEGSKKPIYSPQNLLQTPVNNPNFKSATRFSSDPRVAGVVKGVKTLAVSAGVGIGLAYTFPAVAPVLGVTMLGAYSVNTGKELLQGKYLNNPEKQAQLVTELVGFGAMGKGAEALGEGIKNFKTKRFEMKIEKSNLKDTDFSTIYDFSPTTKKIVVVPKEVKGKIIETSKFSVTERSKGYDVQDNILDFATKKGKAPERQIQFQEVDPFSKPQSYEPKFHIELGKQVEVSKSQTKLSFDISSQTSSKPKFQDLYIERGYQPKLSDYTMKLESYDPFIEMGSNINAFDSEVVFKPEPTSEPLFSRKGRMGKKAQVSVFDQSKAYKRNPITERPSLLNPSETKITDRTPKVENINLPDLKIYPTFKVKSSAYTDSTPAINNQILDIRASNKIYTSPLKFESLYKIDVKDLTKPKQETISSTDSKISIISINSKNTRRKTNYKIDTKPKEENKEKRPVPFPTITTIKPINSGRNEPPEPIIPKIPIYNNPTYKTKPTRRSYQGFNVFVKRRGEFRKVNYKPLSRGGALNLGSSIVGRTAAATFKIEKKGRVSKEESTPNLRKFKKKGLLFIEENKFRINSIGELRGITFKSKRGSVL